MPRTKEKESYAAEINFVRQDKPVEIIEPTKQMNSQNEKYYAATIISCGPIKKNILRGNNYFAAR